MLRREQKSFFNFFLRWGFKWGGLVLLSLVLLSPVRLFADEPGANAAVESFRRASKQQKPEVHLSAREEEVLILLSKGYSNKEIASQLAIGTETVGSHLKHIYEKMRVRSRAEAVARYMTSKKT